MWLINLLSGLGLLASVAQASPRWPAIKTFSSNVVFTPPSNYTDPQVLYARTVELFDGTLLATWENYSPEPPPVYFPIFESKDHGVSWREISKVTDQGYGWGLRYQPFLYELPVPFGGFPAGTVLLAGSSIPTDLSQTQIDLYASTDKGHTWSFVSHIAAGGRAIPNNGETPVWEPFLMIYKDQMVCYYSDQRDPAHGQKLVHQTSSDLRTWDYPVDDVAYANYTSRPGMTTITQLPDGRYIMTYEYGGGPGYSNYKFPVYYRISANPLEFNAAPGHPIITKDGFAPMGSPYIVWSSIGGPNGTLVVSDGSDSEVFVNGALGADSEWEKRSTPQAVAYTRHLRVFKEDPNRLLIMGAGHLPPSTTNNVGLSVVDLARTVYGK
ncbi:glycoside hydrolase family 93 protein [Thozetella sp. PMI_491]|nr:glycoside hydrolase family 93 protein [Thozetella sp. PMI_491]